MSNRILTGNIATGQKLPMTAARLDFIQNNVEALSNQVILGLLGSYTANTIVVLYGCVLTGTDPGARTMTAGAIYYNGLIYSIPAASFTTTGSNIPLLVEITTQSDYATFSDGAKFNVQQVQTFGWTQGPSGGSGVAGYIADYNGSNVVYYDNVIYSNGTSLVPSISISSGSATVGTYFFAGKKKPYPYPSREIRISGYVTFNCTGSGNQIGATLNLSSAFKCLAGAGFANKIMGSITMSKNNTTWYNAQINTYIDIDGGGNIELGFPAITYVNTDVIILNIDFTIPAQ